MQQCGGVGRGKMKCGSKRANLHEEVQEGWEANGQENRGREFVTGNEWEMGRGR